MLGSFIWIVILITLLGFLSFAGITFATWVPMHNYDVKRVVALVKLKAGEVFYDLGCGDARLVVAVAKEYKQHALGIEIFPPLYFFAKIRQILNKDLPITIKFGNLFTTDLSAINVVYIFGLPAHIRGKLADKFKKELPAGARVISYVFKVDNWVPSVVDKPTPISNTLYVYEIDKQR